MCNLFVFFCARKVLFVFIVQIKNFLYICTFFILVYYALAIVFIAGNNLVTAWDTELGRLWSTVIEMDLMFLFVLSVVFIVLGIILMAFELFRKEK